LRSVLATLPPCAPVAPVTNIIFLGSINFGYFF
jgi:hypothetical protein